MLWGVSRLPLNCRRTGGVTRTGTPRFARTCVIMEVRLLRKADALVCLSLWPNWMKTASFALTFGSSAGKSAEFLRKLPELSPESA